MFRNGLVTVSVLVLMGLGAAAEDATEGTKGAKTAVRKSLFKDCAKSYSVTCLKLDIVAWVEKLDETENLTVFPGITVVKENTSDSASSGDVLAELGREFPSDPDARIDAYLMKKLSGYFNSHSIRLNFWRQGSDEGRRHGGGVGGKHGMGYLLAAGAMMKGTLMAVAMGGLAALAGKALMAAMMSLLMSAIIGLKSLHHGGHKQTTYEVITKPIVSHHNSHSVSHEHAGHYDHYGRSFETAPLPLGLQQEYKPTNAL